MDYGAGKECLLVIVLGFACKLVGGCVLTA